MKLVILDGHTLNPGDLDWSPLETINDCTVHDKCDAGELRKRAADAEALLTNKVAIDAETIEALPNLRYIGVLGSRYNHIDLDAARKHDIVVSNVPGYGSQSVAQMTFALLLELVHQVGHHAHLVKTGVWSRSNHFSLQDRPLTELSGKTFGLVGYGAIGRQVAQIAAAFGMRVLISTAHPEKYADDKVTFIDVDNLFSESDIISLNCPLTDNTRCLVNTARLARIKQGALLINTGHGQLIDENEVAAALTKGYLGGYATDVLTQEPPSTDNPLLKAPNCIVTPHIAWATHESRQRLLDSVVENVVAFQHGQPINRVA